MKIRTRLAMIIISLLVSLTIVFIFGNLFPLYRTHSLIEQKRLTAYSIKSAHLISKIIQEKIDTSKTFSLVPMIVNKLLESNKKYVKYGEKKHDVIASQNEAWMKDVKGNSALIKNILSNELSVFFKNYGKQFPGKIGEIFLTNKFGAVVASTSKLTTFAHSHKYWWEASYYRGKGRIFLDDRGFDQSSGGQVLGVVVPVFSRGEIVGILKSNINIFPALSGIIDMEDSSVDIKLFREKGLIIIERGKAPLSTSIDDSRFLSLISSSYLKGKSFGKFRGKDYFHSFSLVPITSGGDEIGFGGSKGSIDHIMGNTQEKWYVDASESVDAVSMSFLKAFSTLLVIVFIFIVIAIFVSFKVSDKFTKPIIDLIEPISELGKGESNININTDGSDEIALLAKEISNTAKILKKTTTSKDNLEKEVESRKKLEDRLQMEKDRAIQATKLKDEFVSLVAHDLRSPLATIYGMLEILKKGEIEELGVAQDELLDRMLVSSEHLLKFINELLQINNLQSGQISLKKDEFSIYSVIKELQKDYQYMLDKKKIIFKNLVSKEKLLQGDLSLLVVVFKNLITNAIKFTPLKGEITISLEEDNQYDIVNVSDTGSGIQENYCLDLFKKESKTTSLGTEGEKGTGLGLPFAYDILKEHEGEISFNSVHGMGTTFVVKLPKIGV